MSERYMKEMPLSVLLGDEKDKTLWVLANKTMESMVKRREEMKHFCNRAARKHCRVFLAGPRDDYCELVHTIGYVIGVRCEESQFKKYPFCYLSLKILARKLTKRGINVTGPLTDISSERIFIVIHMEQNMDKVNEVLDNWDEIDRFG